MKVEYRDIKNFHGYRVGSDGSVWSKLFQKRRPSGYGSYTVLGDEWKLLKPWTKKKTGHKIATLYKSGTQYRRPVHVLVLEAFVGSRPPGLEVCHDDGNPTNNVPGNLYWGSSADNGRDRVRHGRMPKGEAHHRAKLTRPDVIYIKTRLAAGDRVADLARQKNVTPQCIHAIKQGKSWASVTV